MPPEFRRGAPSRSPATSPRKAGSRGAGVGTVRLPSTFRFTRFLHLPDIRPAAFMLKAYCFRPKPTIRWSWTTRPFTFSGISQFFRSRNSTRNTSIGPRTAFSARPSPGIVQGDGPKGDPNGSPGVTRGSVFQWNNRGCWLKNWSRPFAVIHGQRQRWTAASRKRSFGARRSNSDDPRSAVRTKLP